jgi:hypothetical protein
MNCIWLLRMVMTDLSVVAQCNIFWSRLHFSPPHWDFEYSHVGSFLSSILWCTAMVEIHSSSLFFHMFYCTSFYLVLTLNKTIEISFDFVRLSLTLSLSHSLSFFHSLILSLSHSLTLSHSFILSFSHSLTLSLSHSLTLSLSHSITLSLYHFSHSLSLFSGKNEISIIFWQCSTSFSVQW